MRWLAAPCVLASGDGMAKFLLFILVLAAIYLLVKASKRTKPPSPDGSGAEEAMAQCAHCGVHFPIREAIDEAGRLFCCEDHRRLGIRK